MPRSKRYVEAKKLITPKVLFRLPEAIELAKKTSKTKFDSTVELHMHLGIDPKKGDQLVRATFSLPHAAGKTKKVAAFVSGEKEKDALDAGADIAGSEELIEQIAKSGKADFDVAVATPDMMPKLAKIAKILGPKGLMPNPRTETVGTNVKKMVEELKKGKVAVKNDDTANIHLVVGKVSMDSTAMAENIDAAINAIRRAKPSSSKGTFLQTVVLKTTMGPAIRLEVAGA